MCLFFREGALNVVGYLEKLSLTDMSFTAIHQQVSFPLLPQQSSFEFVAAAAKETMNTHLYMVSLDQSIFLYCVGR